MITDAVKRKIALYLKEVVDYANVGNGGNASNAAATSLDVPILSNTTVTVVPSESDESSIDFKATFTGSQLQGNTIREFGLFGNFPLDTSTDDMVDSLTYDPTVYDASTNVSGDLEEKMIARVNFDGLGPFASNEQLEIIFTVEVE
tara:strand:+ start:1203 stop:1640 length:438 start_codon:yes stop_codon:yes gene_type:complete